MFTIVEIVESKIEADMEQTKGAVIYDGWTNNSTHFMGIFAVYMRKISIFRNSMVQYEKELACPLLSARPMAAVDADEGDDTVTFSAKVHGHFFEDIFSFYGVNVHEWVVCELADNCIRNKCTADFLEIPHVGSNNHKLNLEVRHMMGVDITM